MKTTGFFVFLVGVAIALFSAASLLVGASKDSAGTMNGAPQPESLSLLPFAFAAAAVLAGTALMLYGKKGYVITQDPQAHN